jgi:tetratricopeptide (TPR) repeat protein
MLALFRKKSSDAAPAVEKPKAKPKRDLHKAKRFFEHGQTTSDARNYDYAIELYINGLRHEPDSMTAHEALRDVALRRKVNGGRPAGFREKNLSFGRKDPIEKFLHAEMLWSKDPLSLQVMMDVMARAVEVHESEPELAMGEVAYWIGMMILEKGETDRPPAKRDLVLLRDLFAKIGAFAPAVAACRMALQFDPKDAQLQKDLDDLEAERAMQEGNYAQDKVEDIDFRQSIRDEQKQAELEQEDTLSKTEQSKLEIAQRRRQEFAGKPDDDQRLKLVRALLDINNDEHDDEAIRLLQELFDHSGQYRHKVAVGDVQMRKLNRQIKTLRSEADGNPQVAEQLRELTRQKVKFELAEFTERVQNYPTDRRWKYELGQRLMLAKRLEEAIGMFQQAKADPKYRFHSYLLLGRCYVEREWLDLAVDTLKEALEQYPTPDDKLGLELRYVLMDALMRSSRQHLEHEPEKGRELIRDAQRVASQILQVDINFRDIKARLEEIRGLTKVG